MENSEVLLQHAIEAIKEAGMPDGSWSIGGGTVLAVYYNHRLSKDIDVFITDAQYLAELSPRFNSAVEDVSDYLEMTNFISLTFPEGKVDFITSGQLTKFSPQTALFCGKSVPLDDPVEIVTKKMFYRYEQLLPRDLFYLAVVYNSIRKDDLIKSIAVLENKASNFINKFEDKQDILEQELYSLEFAHNLLPGGMAIKGKEIEICRNFVQELKTTLVQERAKTKNKKRKKGLSL